MARSTGSADHPRARQRHRRGFQSAGALVQSQIRKVGESRGFAVSRLLTNWTEVVGTELAALCRPVRAAYGRGSFGATLTVLAPGAAAPVLQARLPELRERVNACYGYTAISRIKITQTAPEGFGEPPAAFEAAAAPEPPALDCPAIETVRDPDLRAALSSLAARVPQRPAK